MIVYGEQQPNGVVLIPQSSHAWLAWQLAEHWGNRRFARPTPRAEVLTAVLLHDCGWASFDSDPGIDDKGRVRTLDRMPVAEHLEIWRASVSRAGAYARYCGLLVANHFARLAGIKADDLLDKGDTVSARRTHSLQAELERMEGVWREILSPDARYERWLKGAGWEKNRRLLEACDTVAVHLCTAHTSPFEVEVLSSSGKPTTVGFEPVDDWTWRVKPWPLRGERVRLRCEGRRWSKAVFGSAKELRDALSNASVQRLTFTLLRPSAAKK